MFEDLSLKENAISAGLLMALLSVPSFMGEVNEQPGRSDGASVKAPFDPGKSQLDFNSNVARMTGALQQSDPPEYDGPVKWQKRYPSEDQLMLIGIMGGVGALTLTGLYRKHSDNDTSLRGHLLSAGVGFAALAGIGGLGYEPIKVVEFGTRIQSVESTEPAHMERHRSVKSYKTVGPFYSQVVMIPESNVPLAANSFEAPLVQDMHITARFYVNGHNQIVSWDAEPAAR